MPQFRALLAALTGAHARRTLEPRLQRQLHQAVQHAHAAGTVGADALPPELARSAAKWWSKAAVTVPSLSLHAWPGWCACMMRPRMKTSDSRASPWAQGRCPGSPRVGERLARLRSACLRPGVPAWAGEGAGGAVRGAAAGRGQDRDRGHSDPARRRPPCGSPGAAHAHCKRLHAGADSVAERIVTEECTDLPAPACGQVVGPHETARSGELLGGPRAAARLLSAHGWDVLYLQVGQLPAGLPHRQQLRRLETLLRQNGVLAAGAASRRKAAPADGARL